MNEAIATLKQRFTAPSADLMQQHPLCGICWTDYDGEDQPVKLPCGHVFGEQCVIAWARGTTPTGRYNGCPSCRAELIPPDWHSRTTAVRYWLSDVWPFLKNDLWPDLKKFVGGPLGVALMVGLKIANIGASQFPESQIGACIRVGSAWWLLVFFVNRIATELGWKWTILMIAVALTAIDCMRWLAAHLHW